MIEFQRQLKCTPGMVIPRCCVSPVYPFTSNIVSADSRLGITTNRSQFHVDTKTPVHRETTQRTQMQPANSHVRQCFVKGKVEREEIQILSSTGYLEF